MKTELIVIIFILLVTGLGIATIYLVSSHSEVVITLTGIKIPDKQLQRLSQILGLTAEQAKAYLGLMNLGTGTLGQVSTVSGLDVITTGVAIKDLLDQGFVVEIPGIIKRYLFQQPFLESFVLAYDPITLMELKKQIDKRLSSSVDILDDREMFDKFMLSNIKTVREEMLENVQGDLRSEAEKFIEVASKKLVDISYMVMKEKQDKTKKLLEKSKGEFDVTVLSLVEKIKETRATLREVLLASRSLEIPSEFSTDVLYGESSIILMMRDLITRTKRNLAIIMPQPELRALMIAAEISKKNSSIRINVTGDLAKTPKSILKKILSESNIRMKQYPEIEFWCVIRDNEEMIFAPHVESTADDTNNMIGIISQNESLIQLIQGQVQGYAIRGSDLTVDKVDEL
ncbi:MAG: helix-turn-helix domain-containing protein [Candidatus Odinarchaeota archaeon]